MFALKTFKTLIKSNVPNDCYKSIYVKYPSSSTDKTKLNKNQQE